MLMDDHDARGTYIPTSQCLRVGHITPSSNTVLEPMVTAMNLDIAPHVTHHYTRVGVTHIALDDDRMAQFSRERMLAAAELLADADMNAIVWNGTSGSRAGVDTDRSLCAAITERTGVPASTSTLAMIDAAHLLGVKRYALAAPYTDDVAERIIQVYGDEGLNCASWTGLGIVENKDMAYVEPDQIRAMVRAADSPEADCVFVVCTGIAAAPLVAELEQELGKPIIDSIAATVWQALRLLGEAPVLEGWGMLLQERPATTGVAA